MTIKTLQTIPTLDLIAEIEKRSMESHWVTRGIITMNINPNVQLDIQLNHKFAGSHLLRDKSMKMILLVPSDIDYYDKNYRKTGIIPTIDRTIIKQIRYKIDIYRDYLHDYITGVI